MKEVFIICKKSILENYLLQTLYFSGNDEFVLHPQYAVYYDKYENAIEEVKRLHYGFFQIEKFYIGIAEFTSQNLFLKVTPVHEVKEDVENSKVENNE